MTPEESPMEFINKRFNEYQKHERLKIDPHLLWAFKQTALEATTLAQRQERKKTATELFSRLEELSTLYSEEQWEEKHRELKAEFGVVDE